MILNGPSKILSKIVQVLIHVQMVHYKSTWQISWDGIFTMLKLLNMILHTYIYITVLERIIKFSLLFIKLDNSDQET